MKFFLLSVCGSMVSGVLVLCWRSPGRRPGPRARWGGVCERIDFFPLPHPRGLGGFPPNIY